MTFNLSIRLENADFDAEEPFNRNASAVALILERLADRLRDLERVQGADTGKLRDSNGNTVGAWGVSED